MKIEEHALTIQAAGVKAALLPTQETWSKILTMVQSYSEAACVARAVDQLAKTATAHEVVLRAAQFGFQVSSPLLVRYCRARFQHQLLQRNDSAPESSRRRRLPDDSPPRAAISQLLGLRWAIPWKCEDQALLVKRFPLLARGLKKRRSCDAEPILLAPSQVAHAKAAGEDGSRGNPLCNLSVMTMRLLRHHALLIVGQSILHCRCGRCTFPVAEVTIHLFHAQCPQLLVSKEVFLQVIQIEHARVVRIPSHVPLFPPSAVAIVARHERGGHELDRPRRPHHMEIQKPIVAHAQPHGAALEEILDTVSLSLKIVPNDIYNRNTPSRLLRPLWLEPPAPSPVPVLFSPLLRLRRIFTSVLASLVSPVSWVKRQEVDGGRREHGEIELVGNEPPQFCISLAQRCSDACWSAHCCW
jgi:hypothetical protein